MEVIVRIIKQNPWAGVIKWPNCFDKIGSYLTRSGNRYTGLTPEDARRLEKAMGFAENYLAPQSPFWDMFAVKVDRKDLILDTNKPEDELKYLFLRKHLEVADGLAKVTARTRYVLINRDAEAKEVNKANKTKREAYRAMDKMSIEDMRKCLRLYGIRPDNLSNELIESKISEQIEADPSKFILKWVDNPNKEISFIIEEALAKNVIRKNRSQYYFGTDLIGNGFDDVVAYLNKKANNEIKVAILQEISAKKDEQ